MLSKLEEKIREYSNFLVEVIGNYQEADYDLIYDLIKNGRYRKDLPLPDSDENINIIINFIDSEKQIYNIRTELAKDTEYLLGNYIVMMLGCCDKSPSFKKSYEFVCENNEFISNSIKSPDICMRSDLKVWEENLRKSCKICKELLNIFREETGLKADTIDEISDLILCEF